MIKEEEETCYYGYIESAHQWCMRILVPQTAPPSAPQTAPQTAQQTAPPTAPRTAPPFGVTSP